MKMLETAQDKIQEICNRLKEEAIEPGKREAEAIVEQAQKQAEKIVADAQQRAAELLASTKKTLEQEKQLFDASMQQSARQAVIYLREVLEQQFFNTALRTFLVKAVSEPKALADLLNALVQALEKEGFKSHFTAILPAGTRTQEVLTLLLEEVKKKLAEQGSMEVGEFKGGIKLRLKEEHLTFDLSDQALMELLERPLRKEFRKWLFA